MTDSIIAFASKGLNQIKHPELRERLLNVFKQDYALKAGESAQNVFDRVTKLGPQNQEPLCFFLNAWKTVHLEVVSVAGLMVRLLTRFGDPQENPNPFRAAAEIALVIPEDSGVDDTPHWLLFENFANALVPSEEWKKSRFSLPECRAVSEYAHFQRTQANIASSITMTIASENWNSGEYVYAASVMEHWLEDRFSMPSELAKEVGRYPAAHAGNTEVEFRHFLHAVYALEHINAVDPVRITTEFGQYIRLVGKAFEALETVLNPTPINAWV